MEEIMDGISTVFQVFHNVGDRKIIVSVGVDPAVGTSEEDQYHAILYSTITSPQVYEWDQFQFMNKNSRPWLVTKVREVIEKEIKRKQVMLSGVLEDISKGVPKKPESVTNRALTKAYAIGLILIDKKR